MKLDEEAQTLLRAYIASVIRHYADISEQDLLTDYVIELLKVDKPNEDLRQNLENELETFLSDHTGEFVSNLFSAIGDVADDEEALKDRLRDLSGDHHEQERDNRRDRERNDYSDHETHKQGFKRKNSRSPERESDGIKRPRIDEALEDVPTTDQPRQDSRGRGRGRGRGQVYSRQPYAQRMPCPDYFQRGYCPRGDACPFDHGQNQNPYMMNYGNMGRGMQGPGMVPMAPLPVMAPMPVAVGDFSYSSFIYPNQNPYPSGPLPVASASGSTAIELTPHAEPQFQRQQQHSNRGGFGSESHRGRGRGGGPSGPSERNDGDPSPPEQYGGKGYRPAQNDVSLTVVGIPHQLNTLTALSEHFSKFGHVVNVEINQPQRRAVIKYSAHSEALAAFKSPDLQAVMSNRFIKVFWTKPADSAGTDAPNAQVAAPEAQVKQPTAEEFKKFQDDRKKALVEKMVEMQKQKLELAQKKRDHVKNKQAMLSELIAMSKKPDIQPKALETLLTQVQSLTQSIKTDLAELEIMSGRKPSRPAPKAPALPTPAISAVKPAAIEQGSSAPLLTANAAPDPAKSSESSSQPSEARALATLASVPAELKEAANESHSYIVALEQKLAALKEQAMQLGVPISPYACEPTRGRGRGRGRGERGRGRGRGRGQIQQKFSSFRLDNRQPAFVLSDMPAGNLQDQVLRDHFTRFQGFQDIAIEGQEAVIRFESRAQAEQALRQGAHKINEHSAKVKWVETPIATNNYDQSFQVQLGDDPGAQPLQEAGLDFDDLYGEQAAKDEGLNL